MTILITARTSVCRDSKTFEMSQKAESPPIELP